MKTIDCTVIPIEIVRQKAELDAAASAILQERGAIRRLNRSQKLRHRLDDEVLPSKEGPISVKSFTTTTRTNR